MSGILQAQTGQVPDARMIEEYFNANGVLGVPDVTATTTGGSNNSYYVGFALVAALIMWLKRRKEEDDDDTLFIKQNSDRSWANFIRDPLNRQRRDNDNDDFDEII